jgi:hypothetical protein
MSYVDWITTHVLNDGASAFIVAVMYFSAWFLFGRWNQIAKPNRRMIVSHIESVKARLAISGLEGPAKHEAERLLAEAAQRADDKNVALLDKLFWSRGQEIAAWNLIHKAECLILETLDPLQVRVRLFMLAGELSKCTRPAAAELASTINGVLSPCGPDAKNPLQRFAGGTPDTDKTLKALLREAQRSVYSQRDTAYAQFMTMHHQVMWMTSVALLICVLLSMDIGNSRLLLIGATGGVLSRLTRTLMNPKHLPTDYGANWTSMYLSPVSGALAAWAGILMVSILANPGLGILGQTFAAIRWETASTPITLAVAFLLGFSERFFDQVASMLEQHAQKEADATATQQNASNITVATAPPQQHNTREEVSDLVHAFFQAVAEQRPATTVSSNGHQPKSASS